MKNMSLLQSTKSIGKMNLDCRDWLLKFESPPSAACLSMVSCNVYDNFAK